MEKPTVRGRFFRVKSNPERLFLITSDPSDNNKLRICDEEDEVTVDKKDVWKWIDKGEWIIQEYKY